MKFILSESSKEKKFTLEDVAINQFFVNNDGCLCQKVCYDSFIQITDTNGKPYALSHIVEDPKQLIERILPHVEQIEY